MGGRWNDGRRRKLSRGGTKTAANVSRKVINGAISKEEVVIPAEPCNLFYKICAPPQYYLNRK